LLNLTSLIFPKLLINWRNLILFLTVLNFMFSKSSSTIGS